MATHTVYLEWRGENPPGVPVRILQCDTCDFRAALGGVKGWERLGRGDGTAHSWSSSGLKCGPIEVS